MTFAESDGVFHGLGLPVVYSDGRTFGNSNCRGFRPVFCLKSDVKLNNSNGKDGTTEDKAYDLQ